MGKEAICTSFSSTLRKASQNRDILGGLAVGAGVGCVLATPIVIRGELDPKFLIPNATLSLLTAAGWRRQKSKDKATLEEQMRKEAVEKTLQCFGLQPEELVRKDILEVNSIDPLGIYPEAASFQSFYPKPVNDDVHEQEDLSVYSDGSIDIAMVRQPWSLRFGWEHEAKQFFENIGRILKDGGELRLQPVEMFVDTILKQKRLGKIEPDLSPFQAAFVFMKNIFPEESYQVMIGVLEEGQPDKEKILRVIKNAPS